MRKSTHACLSLVVAFALCGCVDEESTPPAATDQSPTTESVPAMDSPQSENVDIVWKDYADMVNALDEARAKLDGGKVDQARELAADAADRAKKISGKPLPEIFERSPVVDRLKDELEEAAGVLGEAAADPKADLLSALNEFTAIAEEFAREARVVIKAEKAEELLDVGGEQLDMPQDVQGSIEIRKTE